MSMNQDRRGFTLIELTVTLLIITIILAITLPKIGNAIFSSDLNHSVRQLRALLSVARNNAILERVPRRIVCDIPKGEIRIEREIRKQNDDQDTVRYERDRSVLIHTFRLPAGVKIEDVITETGEKELNGIATLRIGVNGTIAGNLIHLKKKGEPVTLKINPLTGRVTIEKGYIEEYRIAQQNG